MIRNFKQFLFGSLPQDATKFYNGVGGFSVPAGSGGGAISVARTTWTDSDIKSIPTTSPGLELVAAPGGTDLLLFLFASFWWNTTAGAYGNVDAAAFAGIGLDNEDVAGVLGDDTAPVGGRIKDVLIGTQIAQNIFTQKFILDAVGWGQLAKGYGSAGAMVNKPLYFYIDNGGSGDFTGGNGANTLVVDTFYATVTT